MQDLFKWAIDLLSNPVVIAVLSIFGITGVGGLIVFVVKTLINYFISVKRADKWGDWIKARLNKYYLKQPELAILFADKVLIVCTAINKDMTEFLATHKKK